MKNETVEIKEGLQFKVPGDYTVFKIKNIKDKMVTVSWMEKGIERFVDYSLSSVKLNFATKTWEHLKP